MTEHLLPEGFADLEPFVADWAIAGSNARSLRRDQSTEAERLTFYAVAQPALSRALTLLDQKPLDQFSPHDTRLMNLMLTLAHIAPAVEAQGDAEPIHAAARAHLPITTSPADQPSAPPRL